MRMDGRVDFVNFVTLDCFFTFSGQKAALLSISTPRSRQRSTARRGGELEVQVDGAVVVEEVRLPAVGARGGVVPGEVARQVQVCAHR